MTVLNKQSKFPSTAKVTSLVHVLNPDSSVYWKLTFILGMMKSSYKSKKYKEKYKTKVKSTNKTKECSTG